MDKIKINLASGSTLEKPLVSAFKSNNAIYVVFDNEINGTMGLPIILVSKLLSGKLVKIEDINEWNSVKEILRMIIAGNQVDYVVVDAALPADDVFFMQLTLPVASFDALKNNYKPNVDNVGTVRGNAQVAPEIPNPVVAPSENVAQGAQVSAPNIDMQNSVQNEVPSGVEAPISSVPAQDFPTPNQVDVAPTAPVAPMAADVVAPVMPTIPDAPTQSVEPVMPSAPVDAQVVAPVTPAVSDAVTPTPVVPTPATNAENVAPIADVINETTSTPMDFTADKEAFLKACENMFDALVAKFRN